MIAAQTYFLWRKLEIFVRYLYIIFFFCMPFTQALTFNVGFPLKFSELALLILAGIYVLLKRKINLPVTLSILLSSFFFIVSISFFVNLFWHYDYSLKPYETRFGYTGDSISRYIYFVLALCAFFVSIDIFLTDRNRFVKVWVYGAVIAAIYSWYLMLFSLFKLPVYLLPGMKNPPQMIGGYIIRSGTFAEGNYMGCFLFLSGVMSFYIRKIKIGLFLFASVFTSFATLGIVSVFFFLVIYLRKYIFLRKYIPYFFLGLLLLLPLFSLFLKTSVYKEYIYNKIFSSPTHVTGEASYSKVDRFLTSKVAFKMAAGNPIVGVGLSNFARHYDRYYTRDNLMEADYNAFKRVNFKSIPNNVYLEVWSEAGTIALLLFIAILACITYYASVDNSKALLAGMLCLIVCLIAFPSFIMIYLWSFLALPVANYIDQKGFLNTK